MRTYFGHAALAVTLGLVAGSVHMQSAAAQGLVQVAQAQQTTIYRTTVRERIVTRPAKRGTVSATTTRRTVTRTPARTTTTRVVSRPAVRERIVTAPAARVVAAAPLSLTPDQRSIVYRAIAEESGPPAAIVTRRVAPLPITPIETTGAAIVDDIADDSDAVIAVPAAPVVDQIVVGSRLPASTPVYALPETALTAVPDLGAYRYATIGGRVVLIDPNTGVVVASLAD